MQEVGYFDTYPQSNEFTYSGQWSNYPFFPSGTLIASDDLNGLFVLAPDTEFVVSAEAPAEAPEAGFSLSQGTPNPFAARIDFELVVEAQQHVMAEAYDLAGRRVATLLDAVVPAGRREPFSLAAGDLPTGTYLVRVTGEQFAATRRAVLAQ